MILYHSSTVDIQEIDLRCSKPNKDFGRGFYLSSNRQQAMDMADNRETALSRRPLERSYG